MENDQVEAALSLLDVRRVALERVERALQTLWLVDPVDATIVRREPPPLLRLRDEEEQAADVRALTNRLRSERPELRALLAPVNMTIQKLLDAETLEVLIELLHGVDKLIDTLPGLSLPPSQNSRYTQEDGPEGPLLKSLSPRLDEDIEGGLAREIAAQRFVASVMQMCRDYRKAKRVPKGVDRLALEKAYQLLDEGVRMPRNYQWIRTDDLRPLQTYLSFADPGDGHLAVTCEHDEFLEGLIVHIEYIDRDNVDRKDLVEAYRLPTVRNASRVRLRVGNAAPCTVFIGRPVFEANNFEMGLLKAAHTMAGVCSSMFAHGIADCKVAMDNMSAREAVEFMRVVAGNVVRDAEKQRLSAAFNINTPLDDDLRAFGVKRTLKERMEIATLAIRLVTLGGFDKIAWDGASDERPSKPFIGQLTRAQTFDLVHAAHECGLETYISAGMLPEHMQDAVFVGVGGVGIGMSLHKQGKNVVGEIDHSKVLNALGVAKKASGEPLGEAARALAQLDWSYAEGVYTQKREEVRRQLAKALREALEALDEKKSALAPCAKITKLLESLVQLSAVAPEVREEDVALDPAKSEEVRRLEERRGSGQNISARSPFESANPTFSDPVLRWTHRRLATFRDAQDEGGAVPLSGTIASELNTLLTANDREGLARMYALRGKWG